MHHPLGIIVAVFLLGFYLLVLWWSGKEKEQKRKRSNARIDVGDLGEGSIEGVTYTGKATFLRAGKTGKLTVKNSDLGDA